MDPTALSYWFPKLEAAGLPVPKTLFVPMSEAAQSRIWSAFDGKEEGDHAAFEEFVQRVTLACDQVGRPAFLRTDHTSGKHNWASTCYISQESEIANHVYALAEFSEMAGFTGLPWDMFVVREFLPTIPLGVCPHYGDMPVCREFRFFVDDDKIEHIQPYWPLHAIEDGGCENIDYASLCRADAKALAEVAQAAGRAVGGAWSVDLLETERGWFVTDMAEAHKSYRYDPDDVQNAVRVAREATEKE